MSCEAAPRSCGQTSVVGTPSSVSGGETSLPRSPKAEVTGSNRVGVRQFFNGLTEADPGLCTSGETRGELKSLLRVSTRWRID